ncbi:MAG TPA: cation:proton antiporter [Steroidobacteraceae bacterium]
MHSSRWISWGLARCEYEAPWLASIDFSDVLMQSMLSLLVFAGALHVDLNDLKLYRWQIGILAVIGTTISTVLIGFAVWYCLPLVGLNLPCLTVAHWRAHIAD